MTICTACLRHLVLSSCLLAMAGCSERSTDLAEQVAAAQAAATRAEAAAERAEKAAKAAGGAPPVVMEAEPDENVDGEVVDDEPVAGDAAPATPVAAPGA